MICNKIINWKKKYTCFDDCKMSGCPGHECHFEYFPVTEGFYLDFGDGTQISIDKTKLELLQTYINELTK